MHRTAFRLFGFAVVLGALASCREAPSSSDCEPGETRECTCPSAGSGVQRCAESGGDWERCVCEGADADADADEIAPPDGDVDEVEPAPGKVDILFVVDDSNAMDQEQAVLAEQVEVMIRELISPTNPGASAVDDLHLGVVTSDMGSGGYAIVTCNNPTIGDGGALQMGGAEGCSVPPSAPDCDLAGCPWLTHSSEYPDDGTEPGNPPIWEDLGCIATVGTEGCGFEQPLESSLAALTLQASAGMPNKGFLRDDSLLVIVYVTDEDDCSASNAAFFDPEADEYFTMNVRCALNPDELYSISRYHAAFLALRNNDADRLVVAAIVGIPTDGRWNPGDPIEQLREMVVVDPENPNELMKSCDTAMGTAFPPVRIAELVYSFGDHGILESICRQDWTPALQAITRMIQDSLPPAG